MKSIKLCQPINQKGNSFPSSMSKIEQGMEVQMQAKAQQVRLQHSFLIIQDLNFQLCCMDLALRMKR